VDRLIVVTWNVHVGHADVRTFVQRLRAGDFTGGQRVSAFVLLLQEAVRRDDSIPAHLASGLPVPSRITPGDDRETDVRALAAGAHLAILYAPSMRNGLVDLKREDRGNAILSTLPLGDAAVIELPVERQRRAAVEATIQGRTHGGREWLLRAVDVHLDTALALSRGGPFAARRRQAEALLAALAATAPGAQRDASVTIVAGDFNTWGGREPALDVIRRRFSLAPALDAPTFRGPLGFRAALDHVFIGGTPARVEVQRLSDRFGSDHHPILATISFE
jgi:endonuclease/exonuclease/phosphatase family metal-dependent hydrolase